MCTCMHRCCRIRDNDVHEHADPPEACRRCERAAVAAGEPVVTLAQVIADVVVHVVPQLAGLPGEPERSALIASTSSVVYAQGLIDPNVQVLPAHEQRAVLAARVGLDLVFPS